MNISKQKTLLLITLLAISAAVFDYIVRTYTLGWTEAPISQLTVFLSPVVYFALFTMGLLSLRNMLPKLSKRGNNITAALLISFSLLVLSQVFLRKQGVGSASYSIVSPLFVSGVPFSILTYLLFFRKIRSALLSYAICLVAVFWLIMPIGIDTLYVTQGGYRGSGLFQFAVISTSYDLIQYIAAFGIFIALITTLATVIITACRMVKAKGIDRLYSLAVGLSIFTLSIQFINWGAFVWD